MKKAGTLVVVELTEGEQGMMMAVVAMLRLLLKTREGELVGEIDLVDSAVFLVCAGS